MIPKRMFFYWGNDKMSWMRYMTLYSFRKFNPEWEIILYKSKQDFDTKVWDNKVHQDFFSYKGESYYDLISELNITIVDWDIEDNKVNPEFGKEKISSSHKSNFLKWSKLYEEGGFYSDLDILYFKSMDDLYNKVVDGDYDGLLCQTGHLSIGFLASKPGNVFFKDVFNSATKTFNSKGYQSAGVTSVYELLGGIDKSLDKIHKKYTDLSFYNLPFDNIYPFIRGGLEKSLNNIMKLNYDKSYLKYQSENTIGFHWYAGHPLSQKLNNLLNKDNYNEYNNIITDLVNKYSIL